MDREKTSRTEHETWVEEAIFNTGGHEKTTISDGEHKVEGYGRTSEESQKNASEKWDENYGDDDDDDE